MLCIRYPVAVNYSIMRLFSLCTIFCIVWRKFGVNGVNLGLGLSLKPAYTLNFSTIYLSMDFIVGKSNTSRIAGESVRSITIRSIP